MYTETEKKALLRATLADLQPEYDAYQAAEPGRIEAGKARTRGHAQVRSHYRTLEKMLKTF